MNPLGSLPSSNSRPFSLNGLDAVKLFRLLVVLILSLAIDYGVPLLTGHQWKLGDMDITPIVLALTPIIVEAARRFILNSGVQVPKSSSLQDGAGEALKIIVAEAVREHMAAIAPTPEQIEARKRVEELRAQLAQAEAALK